MATLVVDTGQDLVGIFSVEDGTYLPYGGSTIAFALDRIAQADEVVTFNGEHYDLKRLGEFAGLHGPLPLQGTHSDMRLICWSDRIWGANLQDTYRMHFESRPTFPDTHEGSNHLDTYMTFKLWQKWKTGELVVLDGQRTGIRPAPGSRL